MELAHARRIHCIGIGGIGVSALAQLFAAQGKEVSGSDVEESEITRSLNGVGIDVIYGGKASGAPEALPPGIDLVIYSDAVPEDNVERVEARQRGITEMSYAQALGEVSRAYRTIVVTGTHGKSTTTAMLGLMLEAAGMDPLVIVGSKVKEWGNNNIRIPRMPSAANGANIGAIGGGAFASSSAEHSRHPFFVVEGDDYRNHFLELSPYAVVITNIEHDHPDYFRDLGHTVDSFGKLVERLPADGVVVINEDDQGCQQLMNKFVHSPIRTNRRIVNYGRGSERFKTLTVQVPGEFNRYNAAAAATAAMELGVSRDVVEKVDHDFRGVWRRFEIVGELDFANGLRPANNANIRAIRGEAFARSPITIISDYGHHPTAIRATMKAARQMYPGHRLVLIFQPHQHSRTKYLFNEFVDALKDAADPVILSEIYAVKGRMEDREVSSRDLVEAISHKPLAISRILYGGDLDETKRVVLEEVKPGDVVIFMGAGDIDNLARDLCTSN